MTKKNEGTSNGNIDKDDLEKRRPKPFRYISDLSELSKLDDDPLSTTSMSLNSEDTVKKLIDQFDSVVGIGDMNAIERVLQRHEKRNKKHDPSIE